MCVDMKLSQKAAKDKNKAKYELSNFCEQYGLPHVASSRHKYNKKKSFSKPYTKYKNKYSLAKSHDKFYTKPKKKSNKIPKSKSTANITCYNCCKKCHYSNKCKIKEKLNQLQITDEHQTQIFTI